MFDVTKDMKSLSEFKKNSTVLLQGLRRGRRALVLTVDDRPEAVAMSPGSFQDLLDYIADLEALVQAKKGEPRHGAEELAQETEMSDRRKQENLKTALSMIPLGLRLAVDRMRREFPDSSEGEIQTRARELLRGGEGSTKWFQPISAERRKRIFGE